MPIVFDSLHSLLDHGFDTVIDVRSPAEFAEDHIPGAINLPALSNAQHAQVGTIYKQVSPFDGRKVGAAMVAHNVADHIAGPMADKDGSWRPLVYCWRGGQRSGSFASILTQIGWRAETVQGGYQTFRRLVHKTLYDNPLQHGLILLDGNTGTGKTAILGRLAKRGVQTLDLEALAAHRGSLLGAIDGDQPSQKAFETALAVALGQLDPSRPAIVEAESSKIGKINLPPQLWTSMIGAPRIVVKAPVAARAAYLTRAYADISADPDEVARRLKPLRYLRGHDLVDQWINLLNARELNALATSLIVSHYDAAYAKSRQVNRHKILGTVHATTLDDAGLDDLATDIEQLVI